MDAAGSGVGITEASGDGEAEACGSAVPIGAGLALELATGLGDVEASDETVTPGEGVRAGAVGDGTTAVVGATDGTPDADGTDVA